MELTSSEAAKLLRKLNDEIDALKEREELGSVYVVASGEDAESLRPEYDYRETQDALAAAEQKVRTVKHALNVFNSTHTLPGYGITVDEALILIPQLTARKQRLSQLKNRLPKTRATGTRTGGNIIDYLLTNYDPKTAQADYDAAADLLSGIQTALDLFNTTERFELDIEL